MKTLRNVNIERILWCCRDRGVSPDELAAEVGIRPERIEKIIAETELLSVSELQKVAKFFNRGLLFFLEASRIDERELRTSGFRTLTNEKPNLDPRMRTLIERVENQRSVFLDLREDLDGNDIVVFNPPNLIGKSFDEGVDSVRSWLGEVKERSFAGYREAIERKGILVFRSNGYSGPWQVPADSTVCGFSILHTLFPIIFVRKQNSERRQLFTLIHELAHLLLHRNSFADSFEDLTYRVTGRGKEFEANGFAGNFLVPANEIVRLRIEKKPIEVADYDNWLKPFSGRFGVSTEVVLRRLLDTGRIDRHEYQLYRDWKANELYEHKTGGSRGYRFREPLHIFGGQYVRTVFDALQARQITLNKASSYLDNLKISDLHRLERSFYATF